MSDMKYMTNQGGPNPGDNPTPARPPGEEPSPERRDPEPIEQPGNPNPDESPNEIRAADADYQYTDGRPGAGEVPTAEDRDDLESGGRSPGTADDADDDSVDGEYSIGAGQNRNKNLNGQLRNPE